MRKANTRGGEQFEHLGSYIDWIPEFGQGCKETALQYSIWGRGSKGFMQPLQIPGKSPPSLERGSDNGHDESDGYSLGNVMSMMMMQNHLS